MMRAVLGGLVFCLGCVLAYQWYGWTAGAGAEVFLQTPSAQPDSDSVSAPLPPIERPGPLGDFAIVIERPLFNKERRPIEKPQEVGAVTASRERPSLVVSAIVAVQGDFYAHARTPKNELLRLAPGDEYQGWRVEEVLSDRLVLLRDERREEFELRPFPEVVTENRK